MQLNNIEFSSTEDLRLELLRLCKTENKEDFEKALIILRAVNTPSHTRLTKLLFEQAFMVCATTSNLPALQNLSNLSLESENFTLSSNRYDYLFSKVECKDIISHLCMTLQDIVALQDVPSNISLLQEDFFVQCLQVRLSKELLEKELPSTSSAYTAKSLFKI